MAFLVWYLAIIARVENHEKWSRGRLLGCVVHGPECRGELKKKFISEQHRFLCLLAGFREWRSRSAHGTPSDGVRLPPSTMERGASNLGIGNADRLPRNDSQGIAWG